MKQGECHPKCFDAFKSPVSLRFLVVVIGFAFRLREWGNWPCGIIQLRLVRQSGGGLIICLELAMVFVGDLCLKLDSLNCIDYTLVCFISIVLLFQNLENFLLFSGMLYSIAILSYFVVSHFDIETPLFPLNVSIVCTK